SDPALGAVPGHLLPDAARPEMVRDRLSRDRASLRTRVEVPRQGAEARHPDLLLREGRPALLQQRRGRRCRWENPRRLSKEPHSGWPRLSREILLPPRRYRIQGMEHTRWDNRRRHLLGPMVSGERPRDGVARR